MKTMTTVAAGQAARWRWLVAVPLLLASPAVAQAQAEAAAAAGDTVAAKPAAAAYGPPAPARNKDAAEAPPPDNGPPPPGVPEALARMAIAAAYTHPQIRASEGQIRAAGYDARGAKWLRFPSLQVEALAISKGTTRAATDGTVLNAILEQPLWTGGRIKAAIDRSAAQLMVQRAGLDETARDLVLRTVQAYYDVALAARRNEVLADALRQHRELVETISNRVTQQISPQSDLDLARTRAAQVEQQLALVQAQRRAALNTLIELTGDPSPVLGNVPPYDPAVHHPPQEGAIERALACDPRTARLTAQSIVARAEQRSAKAALLPQLVGQLSRNEILGERVGVALRAQTGNGLSQAAAAQGAGERARASEDAIISVQRDLREGLRLDFVNNNAARQRIAVAGTAASGSRLVVDSYKRQFIAGRRTWLDVMNALQESTSTRLSVEEAQVTAQLTAARIMVRSCTWEPRPRFDQTMEPRNGGE